MNIFRLYNKDSKQVVLVRFLATERKIEPLVWSYGCSHKICCFPKLTCNNCKNLVDKPILFSSKY